MILYLSSNEHTNLLDFMDRYDETGSNTIKKMTGNFTLKQFILYDMRNFSHCTELILDRGAFLDTDMEFVEAVKEFYMMYQARVTVIQEGLLPNDSLFNALLENGIGNIVSSTEIGEIQSEIRECLSERGMIRHLGNEIKKSKKDGECYQFTGKNIKIAVFSSMPRMGATTAAIGMASWLAQAGAKVDYVEVNNSGHLSSIVKVYEMEESGRGYLLDGVGYYEKENEKENEKEVNFIIYDVGINNERRAELVEEADILILVCGTKPYELGHTLRSRRQLEGQRAFLFCPFVGEEFRGRYEEVLSSQNQKVLFSEYQPDMFMGKENAESFKIIVEDYIARV